MTAFESLKFEVLVYKKNTLCCVKLIIMFACLWTNIFMTVNVFFFCFIKVMPTIQKLSGIVFENNTTLLNLITILIRRWKGSVWKGFLLSVGTS